MNPYESPQEIVQAEIVEDYPQWLTALWVWIKALIIVELAVLFAFFFGWACQGFPIPWKPYGP